MTAQTLFENPSISYRILLEITAGQRLQAWVATGGSYPNVFQVSISQSISSVRFNLDTDLTGQGSIADVNDNAGSWFHDGETLYVNPPADESVFGGSVIQAVLSFLFSNKDGVLNGQYYEGRLAMAPVVSTRIEEQFGTVNQVGGGDLTLLNGDKYFSGLTNIEWKAGRVVVKVGGDLPPNNVVAYADFATVATWLIQDWNCDDSHFVLKLVEIKGGISDLQIPTAILDRVTYPTLPDNSVGAFSPLAYGRIFSAAPIILDPATRRFKVAGHAIKSFDAVKIKANTLWNETVFATEDLANGEFTLGPVWDGQAEVAVDFSGKKNADGSLMENASDIAKDLLAQIGETNINTAAFAAARARLSAGQGLDGENNLRKFSIHIKDQVSFLDVIGQINLQCLTYFFNDANGQYFFGVFEPGTGEGLPTYTDLDIDAWSEDTETLPNGFPLYSKVVANYQPREQEQFLQVVTEERVSTQYAFGVNSPVVQNPTLNFWELADARYWAQRTLITDGRLHKRYQFSVAWRGILRRAGELIFIQYDRQNISGVFEIYDCKFDLATGRVTFSVGDLRGFKDQVGFWVDDAAVLPTRFSALAGYGSGSIIWNSDWDPTIKAWARQNVGYWTDENGFADPTDPDSFLGSVWF